jgi:RHH-type rel operon transcriptional repressor/antitoxin RelB
MSVLVSIRLPDETARALEEVAQAIDRPKTFLIRKAIESYLIEQADYQIALDRMLDKDDEIISGSELRKRLGI